MTDISSSEICITSGQKIRVMVCVVDGENKLSSANLPNGTTVVEVPVGDRPVDRLEAILEAFKHLEKNEALRYAQALDRE